MPQTSGNINAFHPCCQPVAASSPPARVARFRCSRKYGLKQWFSRPELFQLQIYSTAVSQRKRQRERVFRVSAATGKARPTSDVAADEVLELLNKKHGLHSPSFDDADFRQAVQTLVLAGPSARAMEQFLTGDFGQGEWEVFYAPHFAVLEKVCGAKFDPIRYSLHKNNVISNVRYTHPILGEGWLSASGTIYPRDSFTVQVQFNRFWVDGANSLREETPVGKPLGDGPLSLLKESQIFQSVQTLLPSSLIQSGMPVLGATEALINTAASTLFPAFSTFPLLFLDNSLAVFQFPAARSNVAVRKVADMHIASGRTLSESSNATGGSGNSIVAGQTPNGARRAAAAAVPSSFQKPLTLSPTPPSDARRPQEAQASPRTPSSTPQEAPEELPSSSLQAQGGDVKTPPSPEPPLDSPTSTSSDEAPRSTAASPADVSEDTAAANTDVAADGDEAAAELAWSDCDVSGLWDKDMSASDDEQALFDMMEMSWVFQQAAKALVTVEVKQTDTSWTVTTSAGMISISETYPLSGSMTSMQRRDMRPGKCSGWVERTNGAVPGARVTLEWEGQLGGKQVEQFTLQENGNLLIRELDLKLKNGRTWSGKSVYRRRR